MATSSSLGQSSSRTREHPRRPWGGLIVGGLVLVVAGAGIGWAASTVLAAPADVLEGRSFTFVDVVPGEVGSSITLNTAANWTLVPVGTNQAAGTVTGVNATPGQEVNAGATLYTVNLRPVVIARGDIPAFRTLEQGLIGMDVVQLQQMLTALGFYQGLSSGTFTAGTTTAVQAWQKTLGVPQDGVVQAGDVVFVPTLPARVALDEEVMSRGKVLAGGEAVVSGLPQAPVFTVPVSETQAALMPTGTRVEITTPTGGVWEGFASDRVEDETAGITVNLAGKDGVILCGDECADVPVEGQTLLSSRIVTVEPVTGLTVPSAALLSAADGTVSVVDDAGVAHPVTVTTSARGMSVIDGVDEGLSVRIPAEG